MRFLSLLGLVVAVILVIANLFGAGIPWVVPALCTGPFFTLMAIGAIRAAG